jgi:hypothetical protein
MIYGFRGEWPADWWRIRESFGGVIHGFSQGTLALGFRRAEMFLGCVDAFLWSAQTVASGGVHILAWWPVI